MQPKTLYYGSKAVLLTILLLATFSSNVLAQESTPTGNGDCLVCHENLYYLHDTGKSYCLCQAKPTCVDCHGGQTGTTDKTVAHTRLVANPLGHNAATCHNCHDDEYQARVDKFIAVAGGRITRDPAPTATPPVPQPTSPAPAVETPLLPERLLQPWRAAGLTLVAAALVMLAFCGIRCYQLDRMSHVGQHS